MKKQAGLLILLITISLVSAGEIKTIDLEKDFGEKNGLILDLNIGDGISFDANNARHVVTIDKIHQKGVDLNIFLFVGENQKTNYVTINEKRTAKLDFDRDGTGDLFIGFKEFVSDGNAKIILFDPSNEIDASVREEITGSATAVTGTSRGNNYINWSFGIIFGILLTSLFVTMIINKQNKKSKSSQ